MKIDESKLEKYIPNPNSDAEIYNDLVIKYKERDIALVDLDTFMMIAWARRGYEGDKHQSMIKYIHENASVDFKRFAIKNKNFGWENAAKFAMYPNELQDKFVHWYKNLRLSDKKYEAKHNVKKGNKEQCNKWFASRGIDVVIGKDDKS